MQHRAGSYPARFVWENAMAYKGFDLSGKVSLITGGNGGIGFGMADALAEAGADVCIWGTNPTKNAAAAEKLKRHGRKVHTQIVDVGDEKQVHAGFAETLKVMGHVDNCVANSGVSGRGKGSILEMDYEEWRRVMRVNLDGVFFTFQCRRQAHGRARQGRLAGGDGQHRGDRGRGALEPLRRQQGRRHRHGARARRRAGALQDHRQFDPAGLDRDRDDRQRLRQREVRRQRACRAFPSDAGASAPISGRSPSIWRAAPPATRRGATSSSMAAIRCSSPEASRETEK